MLELSAAIAFSGRLSIRGFGHADAFGFATNRNTTSKLLRNKRFALRSRSRLPDLRAATMIATKVSGFSICFVMALKSVKNK